MQWGAICIQVDKSTVKRLVALDIDSHQFAVVVLLFVCPHPDSKGSSGVINRLVGGRDTTHLARFGNDFSLNADGITITICGVLPDFFQNRQYLHIGLRERLYQVFFQLKILDHALAFDMGF